MRKKEVWIFKKIWKEDKKWILGDWDDLLTEAENKTEM